MVNKYTWCGWGNKMSKGDSANRFWEMVVENMELDSMVGGKAKGGYEGHQWATE